MLSMYQCMDIGILLIPMVAKNERTYDYMFSCSCSKGHYYKQLPVVDIRNQKIREFLRKLATKNYEQRNKEVLENQSVISF